MPTVKNKFPYDKITGTIEGNDRTIGRDKGLSSSLRKIAKGTIGDENNRQKTQLYVTKAPTRGGSGNRHSRAQRYCFCDEGYQMLGSQKMMKLQSWWRAVRGDPAAPMSPYHIYMKICLKYMAEMAAFKSFCRCSRFQVWNKQGVTWVNGQVLLTDIPVFQADGQDLECYLLLGIAEKKGHITYDAKMIDMRLVHDVTVPGQALVTVPSLQFGTSCLIDVYSYYRVL